MRKLIWKLRFAYYMWKACTQDISFCWDQADLSIGPTNMDEAYREGPEAYAALVMADWY